MATIVIITRKTRSGRRYDVRYRPGGRTYPLMRAGTFKTDRDARDRRDLVAGEIAHGRNPAELLAQLSTQVDTAVSFETWGERFVASRIDVAENTRKMYRSHLRMLGQDFGDRSPNSITPSEIAGWVAEQAETLKPGTIAQRLDFLKLLFDFAEVSPNPARDPRVKLPKRVAEEVNPPSDEHFLAMIDALSDRWRLFFIAIEQGGLRIGEADALRWADVDAAGLRFRLPKSATKTNSSRWVQIPKWLMDAIEATCPLEDRVPERKVFQGLHASAGRQAMTRACRDAKITHYHPHDLRHRRATLWHQHGVPARELAERLGHSKASMSLDVYTHVMPVSEVEEKRLLEALTA